MREHVVVNVGLVLVVGNNIGDEGAKALSTHLAKSKLSSITTWDLFSGCWWFSEESVWLKD